MFKRCIKSQSGAILAIVLSLSLALSACASFKRDPLGTAAVIPAAIALIPPVTLLYLADKILCCDTSPRPGPSVAVLAPAISADGSEIAFPVEYKNTGEIRRRGRLIFYVVASKSWHELHLPDYLLVTDVTFSPDGKHMAMATFCEADCPPGEKGGQIAVTDYVPADQDRHVTFHRLTTGDGRFTSQPRFSPDSRSIAFDTVPIQWFENGAWRRTGFENVAILDTESGSPERELSVDKFLYIFLAGFSSDREIIFTAYAPQRATQALAKQMLGKDYSIAKDIPYSVAVTAEKSSPRIANQFTRTDVNSLRCAANCSVAAFFASTNTKGPFHFELFSVGNGAVRQVTHFNVVSTPLRNLSLSADGTHAALNIRDMRVIVDMKTGEATPIGGDAAKQ